MPRCVVAWCATVLAFATIGQAIGLHLLIGEASLLAAGVALATAMRMYGMERCLIGRVAAVSVGIVGGATLLDLDYSEDSKAEVDFNVVSTDAGRFVELQGTAEGKPFERADMDRMLDLAATGLEKLFAAQAEAFASVKR